MPSRCPHFKCRCCLEFFLPSKANRGRQHFCAKPECRKASKACAQRKWAAKPQNRDYFRGAQQVDRTRAWRKENPGYSTRAKRQNADPPLQDSAPTQTVASQAFAPVGKGLSSDCLQKENGDFGANRPKEAAVQDLAATQDPLVVGLIANLLGVALQDNVAPLVRDLVEQGRRILERDPAGFSRRTACAATTN